MAYLGNDLQVAYQSYKIIDDISGSFNSSLTSFALQVGGVAPVPFPINPQQCLISVNGVVQEPDPTGTSGFNLVGSNIVFASAPTTGHSFFGVILAGADYVNVGVKYPSGSVSAPSITFDTDLDTGIYNPAANELGLVTNGNDALRINSSGDVTIGSDLTVDTDTLYVDSANDRVGVNTASPAVDLDVSGEIRASTGILFGTDTAAVNTLDDYEEGTFTPVVYGVTTAGAGTYTTQVGAYTKIGNVVYITIALSWTAHTGTGSIRISGLPFASGTVSSAGSTLAIRASGLSLSANNTLVGAQLPDGNSYIIIHEYPVGGGGISGVDMDTNASMWLSGHYFL